MTCLESLFLKNVVAINIVIKNTKSMKVGVLAINPLNIAGLNFVHMKITSIWKGLDLVTK